MKLGKLSRSRWPYFQRSKAVRSSFRPRSRWPYFQQSKAIRSEYLDEVVDPVHVGHRTFKLERCSMLERTNHCSPTMTKSLKLVVVKFSSQTPFTFASLSTPLSFLISGRISAELQPKLPSACLLCHRYIILYIIVLCVLHLL